MIPANGIRACPSGWTRTSWHAPGMHMRLPSADWRAGRDAIYQLAALTVGVRLAVADDSNLARRH
jgi:hypothetical protein